MWLFSDEAAESQGRGGTVFLAIRALTTDDRNRIVKHSAAGVPAAIAV